MVFVVPKMSSEAQDEKNIFKTADGEIVKILYDGAEVNEDVGIKEVIIDGNRGDEDVHYGAVMKRNGVTERVYVVSEDGRFITEVIEDDTK